MRACSRGFTLMEIVVVILLLGVLGIYTTQFIGSGTRMYADVAAREQLMNDVRFGVERLNREVRDAIPGTLQVTSAPACIRFWSIKAASRYLQLPGSAAGSTMVAFIPALAEQQVAPGDLALVFPQGLDPATAPLCLLSWQLRVAGRIGDQRGTAAEHSAAGAVRTDGYAIRDAFSRPARLLCRSSRQLLPARQSTDSAGAVACQLGDGVEHHGRGVAKCQFLHGERRV